MAEAADLINDILIRVRDPQGLATPRSDVLALLDRCQVLLVRETGVLIRERSFATEANRVIYNFADESTLKLVDMWQGDRRLHSIDWGQQSQFYGRAWWRATGERYEEWSPYGTTFFVLTPMLAAGTTITIREQIRPTQLTNESVGLDLPSEFHPRLVDLTVLCLLLRVRELGIFATTIAQVQPRAQG